MFYGDVFKALNKAKVKYWVDMFVSEPIKFEVYEHLEHYVRNTTYAHRMQWLKQANDFVRKIQSKRVRKKG